MRYHFDPPVPLAVLGTWNRRVAARRCVCVSCFVNAVRLEHRAAARTVALLVAELCPALRVCQRRAPTHRLPVYAHTSSRLPTAHRLAARP